MSISKCIRNSQIHPKNDRELNIQTPQNTEEERKFSRNQLHSEAQRGILFSWHYTKRIFALETYRKRCGKLREIRIWSKRDEMKDTSICAITPMILYCLNAFHKQQSTQIHHTTNSTTETTRKCWSWGKRREKPLAAHFPITQVTLEFIRAPIRLITFTISPERKVNSMISLHDIFSSFIRRILYVVVVVFPLYCLFSSCDCKSQCVSKLAVRYRMKCVVKRAHFHSSFLFLDIFLHWTEAHNTIEPMEKVVLKWW